MQNWKILIGQLWNNLTSNCRWIISCDLTCLKIHLPIPILRKIQPLKYICLNAKGLDSFFFYNGIKHSHIRWKNYFLKSEVYVEIYNFSITFLCYSKELE